MKLSFDQRVELSLNKLTWNILISNTEVQSQLGKEYWLAMKPTDMKGLWASPHRSTPGETCVEIQIMFTCLTTSLRK